MPLLFLHIKPCQINRYYYWQGLGWRWPAGISGTKLIHVAIDWCRCSALANEFIYETQLRVRWGWTNFFFLLFFIFKALTSYTLCRFLGEWISLSSVFFLSCFFFFFFRGLNRGWLKCKWLSIFGICLSVVKFYKNFRRCYLYLLKSEIIAKSFISDSEYKQENNGVWLIRVTKF